MIFLKAVYDVAGNNIEKAVLHYSIGAGYYFTISGKQQVDQQFLDQVKARMHQIVDANIPIMKRSVGTDEAIELFHKHGMYDKEKLFRYRRVSKVNIYSIENFEDYHYGFMACNTGYIKYFDLVLYKDGMVLMLPEAKTPGSDPGVCTKR